MFKYGSTLFSAALLAVAVMSGSSSGAIIDVDGDVVPDWGATPFIDWAPTLTSGGGTGVQGIDYTSANWGDAPGELGPYPHGGETFDLEAGYAAVSNTDDTFYVAIVSSFPENGYLYSGALVMPGDLAIDLPGGSMYEFGVVGHGALAGQVRFNPTWSLPHGYLGFPSMGPSTMTGGTVVGTASFVYYDAGIAIEGNGTNTYIIEIGIPLGLLGSWDNASLHYTMTCGNDVLNWNVVPEPSCIALMCLAGLGLLGRRRR